MEHKSFNVYQVNLFKNKFGLDLTNKIRVSKVKMFIIIFILTCFFSLLVNHINDSNLWDGVLMLSRTIPQY